MKIETFDLFAAPVTLTYKGKKLHPTKFGGVLSVIYSVSCCCFLVSRLWMWLAKEGDDYAQSILTYDALTNYFQLNRTNLEF